MHYDPGSENQCSNQLYKRACLIKKKIVKTEYQHLRDNTLKEHEEE